MPIQILSSIFGFIKKNIKNFFLYVGLTLVLLVVLFPYDDLADYVTAQVAKATKNQMHLKIDGIGLGIIPTPSLKLENVVLGSSSIPSIKAADLKITPSITQLLLAKIGGRVYSSDLYGSEFEFNFSQDKKVGSSDNKRSKNKDPENPLLSHHLETSLSISNLSLKEVSKDFSLPIALSGEMSLELGGMIDPTFNTQPDGEFIITSDNLKLKNPTISLANFGDITLPNLTFSKVNIKGRIVESELVAEEMDLGSSSDPLSLKVRGKIRLTVENYRGKIKAQFANYELRTQINIHKSLISQFYFISFIDDKKVAPILANYSTYQLKVIGKSPKQFTRMEPLKTFR